ncbi:hypothetical protein ACE7GA_07525 [Roseomonas sp. CCTCC AB2023176]|uniref:hypothetical protein n=1 Tax=Roseomonas sp. CCTCC AB2023176 TaxID=3342640 RepID=UPI0035DE2A05
MAISTRLHGLIDYAAAVSLGGLALSGALRGRPGRVAAMATAVPVAAFLSTDFEGGVVPTFSVREHLTFDVVAGLLLAGTALAMRREPPAARAVLAGYGIAQFLLGLSTDPDAGSGPGDGAGPLERLFGGEDGLRPIAERVRRLVEA